MKIKVTCPFVMERRMKMFDLFVKKGYIDVVLFRRTLITVAWGKYDGAFTVGLVLPLIYVHLRRGDSE